MKKVLFVGSQSSGPVEDELRSRLSGLADVVSERDALPGQGRSRFLRDAVDAAEMVICLVSEEFLGSDGRHWAFINAALGRMREMPPGAVFIIPCWVGDEPEAYSGSQLGHLRGGKLDISSFPALIAGT